MADVRSTDFARSSDAAEILRRLELTITKRLDGLLQGDYRGLLPGHGTEGGETRPYVVGDDIRHIDWNVSARSMETHIRETIADRELETWLLVDHSPSLDFGTASMTKAQLATAAVGSFGFLTARTGNRLGAVVLRGDGARLIPARPGRNHLLALLRGLVGTGRDQEGAGFGGTTELGAALNHLLVPPRKRGLVVAVSDFLSADVWDRPLAALATRHDVIAVEVVDPRELELPPVGTLALVDPETGKTREVTTSRATRKRYAEAARAQRADIARRLTTAGASHLQLRTDRDWVLDMVRFVGHRKVLAGRR